MPKKELLGVWEQIHESRQIHFKEEDTYDEHQKPNMEDDEDLMMPSRNKKFEKGFGHSPYNGHQSRGRLVREDAELNQILESRNQQMKVDIQNARIQINRSPARLANTKASPDQDDEDADLVETLKIKKDEETPKPSKQVELKPIDGDDDFEGMDGSKSRKEPSPLQLSKPALIPHVKNRVKLQPMSLNPIL